MKCHFCNANASLTARDSDDRLFNCCPACLHASREYWSSTPEERKVLKLGYKKQLTISVAYRPTA